MNVTNLSQRLPPFLAIVIVAFTLGVTAVASQEPAHPTYQIQVNGLSCPFCAYGIEKQVNAIEGVENIALDLKAGLLTVTMKKGATLDQATASKAVEDAGFTLGSFHEVTMVKSTHPEE